MLSNQSLLKSTITDLIQFLKLPDWSSDAKSLSQPHLVVFVLFIFSANVALIFLSYFLISLPVITVSETQANPLSLRSEYFFIFLIMKVFLGPLIEELAFRLPATRFEIKKIALAIPFFIFFTLGWASFFVQLLTLVILWSCLFTAEKSEILHTTLSKNWDKNPKLVVYGLSLMFALAHASRFDLSLSIEGVLIAIAVTLPQFISGLIYCYIRIRADSFILVILLHSLWNAVTELGYYLSHPS